MLLCTFVASNETSFDKKKQFIKTHLHVYTFIYNAM